MKAALAATQLAAEKTDIALKEYKTSSNEWRDTVRDLTGRLPTRIELEQQFVAIEAKIADLRESRSNTSGRDTMLEQTRATRRWLIGIVVAVLLSVFAQVAVFFSARVP